MTLNQASAGFRNQGQFIAALHVSRNLNIPFADLKATMLGIPTPSAAPTPGTMGTTPTGATSTTTTSSPLSLGQAIHKLRPSSHSTSEAGRATTQAAADLQTTSTSTSGTSTTTSATTSTKTKKHGR